MFFCQEKFMKSNILYFVFLNTQFRFQCAIYNTLYANGVCTPVILK